MLHNFIKKHDVKARIKGFFKNPVILDNAYGYCCPNCSKIYDIPTAFVHRTFDETCHCYKKYIKCNDCGRTTPAYSNIKDVMENWDNQFILEEDRILLENKV